MPLNLASLLQERLSPQALGVLQAAGQVAAQLGYRAYLVGGAVRDVLLGAPTLDIDLTVEGDGPRMADALARALGGRVSAHSQFGTAQVRTGALVVDVATARRERYLRPGVLPTVAAGTLADDLFRRDFTVNAMAAALSADRWGELVDPYDGKKDLESRQLRVLHDKSFQDDPTRMLRAVRYGRRLGFSLEPGTESLLKRDASFLEAVSGTRRWKELQRLLEEAEPEAALLWAAELELLAHIHHALVADEWLASVFAAARRAAETLPVSPTLYLCLLAFRTSCAERSGLIADFQLPTAKARALQDVGHVQKLFPQLAADHLRPSQMAVLLEGLSPQAIHACSLAAEAVTLRERLHLYLESWRQMKPHLSGSDLIRLGVPQGPTIRKFLADLRAARLDRVTTSKQQEIQMVRRWLAERDT